jgi:uncharacterized protein (TIGR02453 family)
MTFFSSSSIAFLQTLAENNNREWFNNNKLKYEEHLKYPADGFSANMASELGVMTGTDHASKVFRIYRDVRFSKDKTPYNSHMRMVFKPTGKTDSLGWMFSLEKDHLVFGVGVFAYEKVALSQFRERVSGPDGVLLEKILDDLKCRGARLSGADLKRVPAGFDVDHPRAQLLRHKGLVAWLDLPDPDVAFGEKASANCLKEYRKLKPLYDWMLEA